MMSTATESLAEKPITKLTPSEMIGELYRLRTENYDQETTILRLRQQLSNAQFQVQELKKAKGVK